MNARDIGRRITVLAMGGLGLALAGATLQSDAPAGPATQAQVSRAFSGDTVRALLADGTVATVRYIGVDAPAPNPSTCFGPESTLYNRDLVLNRTVWLGFDTRRRTDEGDLLAYVYLDPQGLTMVNHAMVAQGMAQAQSREIMAPNTRYADTFARLQTAARENGLGLWGACPDGQSGRDDEDEANGNGENRPPQAAFTLAPERPRVEEFVRFDASGSRDPDGEITAFRWAFGDGASARGETARHRYTSSGQFTVTLRVADEAGAESRAERTVRVRPPEDADEDPPSEEGRAPTPTGEVLIKRIRYDAPGSDIDNRTEEWIRLRAGERAVELTGWTLADQLGDRGVSSHVFTFPDGFVLESEQTVTVRTGCGEDGRSELFWCARTPIWANGEDTAFLRDADGRLVDRCRYGDPDGSDRGVSMFDCESRTFHESES